MPPMSVSKKSAPSRATQAEEYLIKDEPYYEPVGEEVAVFEAAFRQKLPLLLKGPTGCGKTRFMQHMAWRLKRPLITVSCHDDLTATDLVGRYLITANETTVVIHPLADDRRVLPVEKTGELLTAGPEFCLAISYNPGYQSVLKDLKQSTRQRFVAVEFNYPAAALEKKIVRRETGVDEAMAERLVKFAAMTRNLKGSGLDEGASTRLLVHAGKLMSAGIAPRAACRTAIAEALTDDPEMIAAVNELSASLF
jgi:nitric oxide reductase NorQ protein